MTAQDWAARLYPVAEGQAGYVTRHHAAVTAGGRRGHLYVVCLDTVHAVDAGEPDPHGGVGAVNRRTARLCVVRSRTYVERIGVHGRLVESVGSGAVRL